MPVAPGSRVKGQVKRFPTRCHLGKLLALPLASLVLDHCSVRLPEPRGWLRKPQSIALLIPLP